jgi:hypothetical protein
METPIRHIRIPDTDWKALERIGATVDRKPAWLVRKAIADYIKSNPVARTRSAKRKTKRKASPDGMDEIFGAPAAIAPVPPEPQE